MPLLPLEINEGKNLPRHQSPIDTANELVTGDMVGLEKQEMGTEQRREGRPNQGGRASGAWGQGKSNTNLNFVTDVTGT